MNNGKRTTEPIIIIRNIVPEDIENIVALERQIFSDPWPQSVFVELLREESWSVQIAVLNGAIVGYSCYQIDNVKVHLANIAVAIEHRRKLVAQLLLESILHQAKENKCEYVFLEVRQSNKKARAFYDKHGFELMYRQKDYYQSPMEDALVLLRYLNIKD
ncbi:MAG: ribosomal protein S18-alanine N-acetyltransferase [candidate division Zixibacteria bacterium]|nr:ribosomal protein S18-alanine N-acetyltransferase [candidate division Zixibacteria bacterium]